MVQRIDINQNVLNAYLKASHVPLSAIKMKVEKIEHIMSGDIQPTFNQLVKIAKTIHVPVGVLMLDTYLTKPKENLEFRVLNSRTLNEKSDELNETIEEMKLKQRFLREEIEYELPFIRQFTMEEDILEIAEAIRKIIGFNKRYMDEIKSNAFQYFREKINQAGIFVFLNGKVKDNTHRPLDIHEFRGFVLSDKKAPIIFINQTDSQKGRLFTLIHEMVHLFVGHDGIFNNESLMQIESRSIETFVNQITAELLVPISELSRLKTSAIKELEKIYPVSQFVLYRRLLDIGQMRYDDYQNAIRKIVFESKNEVNHYQSNKTYGNYYQNLNYRMEHTFFKYVHCALKEKRISYTDAFQLLGVGYMGFKALEAAID